MNHNKNIKLTSLDISDNLINNMENNVDTSQLVPAHTHTMTINLCDDDGNIVPTTVTLNFFFTSHNPNDVPIYAEFTKLDSNNNPIYKTNFSFDGVEDMSLPIASAILDGARQSDSSDDSNSSESEILENNNNVNLDEIYKMSIKNCRCKTALKNILKQAFSISNFNPNMSFEDIFTYCLKICNITEGLGPITAYELSSDICNFYNIIIPNVYIVRNGTKKSIQSLNISKSLLKTKKFVDLNIKYIPLQDIQTVFLNNKITSIHSSNASEYETYLNNLNKK